MFWYAQFPYIERLKYHKRFILIDCGNGLTDDGMKNSKSSGGLPYCIIYSNNVTWFFWTLMVQHFPTVLVNTSIVRKKTHISSIQCTKKRFIKNTKTHELHWVKQNQKQLPKAFFQNWFFRSIQFFFANFHENFYWTDFFLVRQLGFLCMYLLLSRAVRGELKLITAVDPYGEILKLFVTRGGRKIASRFTINYLSLHS